MLSKLIEKRDQLLGMKNESLESLKSIEETEQLKADLDLTVKSLDQALNPIEAEIAKREAIAKKQAEKAKADADAAANADAAA